MEEPAAQFPPNHLLAASGFLGGISCAFSPNHLLATIHVMKSIVILLSAFLSTALSAITLRQAYERALETRSGLANKKIDENIALLQKSQTLSAFYPNFELSSVNQWRDQASSSAFERQFSTAHQHTARLTMRQMLFHGGAEYEALKIAGLEIEARRLEQQEIELEIYDTVANSFFAILALEADAKNLEDQVGTLEQRNFILKQRVKLGRNKASDLTAALSQAAKLKSELPTLRSKIEGEKQNFLWLIGSDRVERLEDEVRSWTAADDISMDVDRVPAIRARKKLSEIQDRRISMARSEFLPNVDLSASYYVDRTGTPSDSRWDAALNATWLLFSGDTTRSEIRIQVLERNKLENEIADLSRQIQLRFEVQKEQLRLYQVSMGELETALTFAKKTYEEQQRDFEFGLVSNLDVLRALDDLLFARRSYDLEKINGRLLWFRLHTMAGMLP
ncbi:MAG: TolC family protein [Deltaproteobacteria bacterium]|nr:TolC family protein [Deltaproteobacteria bacterium]